MFGRPAANQTPTPSMASTRCVVSRMAHHHARLHSHAGFQRVQWGGVKAVFKLEWLGTAVMFGLCHGNCIYDVHRLVHVVILFICCVSVHCCCSLEIVQLLLCPVP